MGNVLGTTETEVKEVKQAQAEDKILFDKILKKSQELYNLNKEQFLDPNFCERIAITYSKKLYQLPVEKIRTIHDKVENSTGEKNLEVTISYDPLKEEKFLVNELSGRIQEYFKGKKLVNNLDYKGLKISFPDIAYVQNRVLYLLDNMQRRELEKKQQGGHPLFLDDFGGRRNNNNNNNFFNNNNNNENRFIINENEEEEENEYERPRFEREERPRFNKRERFDKGNRYEKRDKFQKRNIPANFKSVIKNEPPKEFTVPLYKEIQEKLKTIKTNKPGNISETTPAEIKVGNIRENSPPEIKPENITKKKNETIKEEVKSIFEAPVASFTNIFKPEKIQENKLPEKIQENKLPEKIQEKKFPEKKFPEKLPEKKFPEKLREKETKMKDYYANEDKYCVDEKQPCKLSKKEMCEKIIYHFIVRNNLIAAITSVVPTPDKLGEYTGSFTYSRLESLKKGTFCLPPYYSDIQDVDENQRVLKILKYLNYLDPKDCTTNGGFLLKLSDNRMRELLSDERIGKKYFEFGRKINQIYQESLNALYNILIQLENSSNLSTNILNELSKRTKYIIDELYIKTQFNYLLAILIVIDFDFVKNKELNEVKKKRIEKIIKEDFSP